MTAAPLTISRLREAHIDFIQPFQQVGITLVTKRPDPGRDIDMRDFSVITPLSPAVWGALAVATVVVGISTTINYYHHRYYYNYH